MPAARPANLKRARKIIAGTFLVSLCGNVRFHAGMHN